MNLFGSDDKFSGAARLARTRHDNGLSIYSLGQSGFILQCRGYTIAVDPYLSASVDSLEGFPAQFWKRRYSAPIGGDALQHIDLVLCTHDHLDHADPETLLAISKASPACRFAVPLPTVTILKRSGIEKSRISILNEGAPSNFGVVEVEPVAVAHENYEADEEGYHRFLGYLLHWSEFTIFHAGDALVTTRLSDALEGHSIDIAFLPINGRDDHRRALGIAGNMNCSEAMSLAAKLRCDLIVPTHYDLYSNNGSSLDVFTGAWETEAMAARPKFKAFLPGEHITYRKADRARELAVIIGAGKTGRGFLARLLSLSAYEVVFIDSDEDLVRRLNEDGAYTIHFFGQARMPFRVEGVVALVSGSEEAIMCLGRASIICTAVGETKLNGVIDEIARSMDLPNIRSGGSGVRILVCENGAAPATAMRNAMVGRDGVEIAEAAIFCSTIELPGSRLDIQSEAYNELPYDAARWSDIVKIPGLLPVAEFSNLLKRKIYTYNCFSACIAYLGALKGYQLLSDAANDEDIDVVVGHVAKPLNIAIAKAFGISLEEQEKFSERAIVKFKDRSIRDDIPRNARVVIRKLGPTDRLISPANFILENGGDVSGIALTIAAAFFYDAPSEEEFRKLLENDSVESVFCEITGCRKGDILTNKVVEFHGELSKRPRLSFTDLLKKSSRCNLS